MLERFRSRNLAKMAEERYGHMDFPPAANAPAPMLLRFDPVEHAVKTKRRRSIEEVSNIVVNMSNGFFVLGTSTLLVSIAGLSGKSTYVLPSSTIPIGITGTAITLGGLGLYWMGTRWNPAWKRKQDAKAERIAARRLARAEESDSAAAAARHEIDALIRELEAVAGIT